MNELKRLLDDVDFLSGDALKDILNNALEDGKQDDNQGKPVKKIDDPVEKLADYLINKCEIRKGSTTYSLLEIEFYIHSAEHPDIITYPRNTPCGCWFFHASGVDLSFGSKPANEEIDPKDVARKDFFGGILIRALRRNDRKEFVGPLNCCYELFDQFSAFEQSPMEYPILCRKEQEESNEIVKYSRYFNFKETKFRTLINDYYRNKSVINIEDFEKFIKARYRFAPSDHKVLMSESKPQLPIPQQEPHLER